MPELSERTLRSLCTSAELDLEAEVGHLWGLVYKYGREWESHSLRCLCRSAGVAFRILSSFRAVASAVEPSYREEDVVGMRWRLRRAVHAALCVRDEARAAGHER